MRSRGARSVESDDLDYELMLDSWRYRVDSGGEPASSDRPWVVIASDVAQARAIRAVLGGRLYLTPVLVATDRVTLLGRARMSRPTGSIVGFRIGVHNPMDRSAGLACHARGHWADETILFRQQPTTTDGLRLPLSPRSRGELSGTARLLRPGGVARIISWCVAHPVMQPA